MKVGLRALIGGLLKMTKAVSITIKQRLQHMNVGALMDILSQSVRVINVGVGGLILDKEFNMGRKKKNDNVYMQHNPRYNLKRTYIEPKSIGQRDYLSSVIKNKLTICDGPAGCGKTLLAAASAVNQICDNMHQYDHIVIVRPAVTACNEKLGYLPGTVESKMEPFTMPVLYSLSKVIGRERFASFLKSDIVKVIPLAYMRGLTLDNCVVIFDEAQNSTPEQMKMFLTRLGEDCKVIVEGDMAQSDIRNTNGLADAIERLARMKDVGIIQMDRSDVVRSGFVQEVLKRYED